MAVLDTVTNAVSADAKSRMAQLAKVMQDLQKLKSAMQHQAAFQSMVVAVMTEVDALGKDAAADAKAIWTWH